LVVVSPQKLPQKINAHRDSWQEPSHPLAG
jgi:hypothetical protein